MEGRSILGRVIICRNELATTPYYLAQIGLNIYSMEELCYYCYQNSYMIDKDFMCDNLIQWIEEEFEHTDLIRVLKTMLKNNASLADFVSAIMKDTAIYEGEELEAMVLSIRENAKLDQKEKRKRRADYLVQQEMYTAAVNEYESILATGEKKDYVLESAVYNNIGYCYARMFMFPCAAEYYEKAYKINGRSGCLLQYMAALKLSLTDQEYREKVLKDLTTAALEPELDKRVKEIEERWISTDAHGMLEDLKATAENGKTQEYYESQEMLVNELREKFRKSENELI